jgi:hypothetical protein
MSALYDAGEVNGAASGAPMATVLVGRDRGRHAVNASGNWRITFGRLEGDAIDVNLEDYH